MRKECINEGRRLCFEDFVNSIFNRVFMKSIHIKPRVREVHLIPLLISIKHLYLSGMRLGVALRRNAKKTRVQKRLDYMLKYDNCSKPDSQHNWGEPICPLNKHENLHFDNEQDIHMSSGNMVITASIWIC